MATDVLSTRVHPAGGGTGTRFPVLMALTTMLVLAPGTASASIYYIGQFSGSSPLDEPGCGTGKGSTSSNRPCATLAYWTQNRRSALGSGDTVRIAPGTYKKAGSQHNCIMARSGVTYEGRSAADGVLDDYTSVRIDLAGCTTTGDINTTCNCNGVNAVSSGSSLSGFAVRDLKIQNAPDGGTSASAGVRVKVGTVTNGFTVDRVWVENVGRQGMIFQQPSITDVDCSGSRLLRNLTITDSRVNGARGVFGGIAVGCTDGFFITRNIVHDNYDASSYSQCLAGASGCNDHDGVQLSGSINGTVADNEVYNCGEDCLDIGGHYRKTYNVVLENNEVHDGASRLAKVSGGAGPNITLRNNYFHTGEGPVEVAACAYGVKFHNNTIWKTAGETVLKLWSACKDCEFHNNILRGVPSAGKQVVFVSRASTVTNGGIDLDWRNNVVIAAGPGRAIVEDLGAGTCNQQGCNCQGLCSVPSWCPSPWPSPQPDHEVMQNELAAFRSQGDSGHWFGSECGDTDVWGQQPAVINPINVDAASLHLLETDSVARNRGATLPGFGSDFDGQTRLGTWDIGADEFVSACTGAPDCNDGLACTDDQCVGGNCVLTDTCSVGQFCSHAAGGCTSESPPTTLPPDPDPEPLEAPRLLSVEPLP